MGLVEDPHEDVRDGVAFALLGRDDDESLRALARLSGDTDQDVRNWATFGLGSQNERDEPWIRNALYARLDDPFIDAAVEGALGLVARGDVRALPTVRRWLEEGGAYTGMLEVAELYAEPSLLPPLYELAEQVTPEDDPWWVRRLRQAITACEQAESSAVDHSVSGAS